MKNFIKALTLLLMTSALFYSCSTSEEPQEEVIPKFQLSVTSNEGGTVSSSGGSYEQGTLISITANPNQEYLFDKWTGSINSNSNPLEITLNKNETIEANFLKKQYELTINIIGNGAVDEELINNSKLYESGSKIKLTAVPEAGTYFQQWQIDDHIITENPIELDLAGPTEVTVSFIGENGIIDYNLFRGNSEEIGKVIEIYKEDKDYIMYGEFNYSDASGLYVPRNVKLVKELSKTENVETFYRLDDLKRPYEIFQKIEGQETEQIQQINYFPDSTVVTLNRIKEDGFLEIISKEVLPKTPFSSTNGENVKDRQLINFSSHGGCDDDLFQEECEGWI